MCRDEKQWESYVLQLNGESLIRKRVRTCSEINSMAVRLATGSAWARYFMASTSRRCPSTYRGSEVRSRRLRPMLGGTGIVKTLAMRTECYRGKAFCSSRCGSCVPQYNAQPAVFQL